VDFSSQLVVITFSDISQNYRKAHCNGAVLYHEIFSYCFSLNYSLLLEAYFSLVQVL